MRGLTSLKIAGRYARRSIRGHQFNDLIDKLAREFEAVRLRMSESGAAVPPEDTNSIYVPMSDDDEEIEIDSQPAKGGVEIIVDGDLSIRYRAWVATPDGRMLLGNCDSIEAAREVIAANS